MSNYVDAIFIGAINLDYIFSKKEKNIIKHKFIDSGKEKLTTDKEKVINENINTMYSSYPIHSHQIGGSAFLAMRSLKAVEPNVKVAYVGVCGKLDEQAIKKGVSPNSLSFDFIDNKEWLFDFNNATNCPPYDGISDIIGRAIVLLKNNGTRDGIRVATGANDALVPCIKRKIESGANFVEFLSKTRWIHISSLKDFHGFMDIINWIKMAKHQNPFLKVSADLGAEYIENYREDLIDMRVFDVFDFMFLSEDERKMLVVNDKADNETKNDNMKCVLQSNGKNNKQILVVKYANKYELYNNIDGCICKKKFWEQKLPMRKIVNDTGAGDFFAGGFIGGMLSDRLLSHQPTPISVGAIAARERLKVDSINVACSNITTKTTEYIDKLMRQDKYNWKQLLCMRVASITRTQWFSIVASAILGAIIGHIWL